jgi:hypothetical protein
VLARWSELLATVWTPASVPAATADVCSHRKSDGEERP